LLLDFQVQFLKVVADCRLLKHLLYSLQITLNKQCKSRKSLSFYKNDPHGSLSKADRFGLQRQHLCDEQQGSHKGEMFAGKACIFWWPISSVLPERNRKEKATGTVESVWQLSTLLNRSSIAAEIRTTTSNY
jgi:hypothetical protein